MTATVSIRFCSEVSPIVFNLGLHPGNWVSHCCRVHSWGWQETLGGGQVGPSTSLTAAKYSCRAQNDGGHPSAKNLFEVGACSASTAGLTGLEGTHRTASPSQGMTNSAAAVESACTSHFIRADLMNVFGKTEGTVGARLAIRSFYFECPPPPSLPQASACFIMSSSLTWKGLG